MFLTDLVCSVKMLYFSEPWEDTSSNLVVRRAKDMDQEHKESFEIKGKFLPGDGQACRVKQCLVTINLKEVLLLEAR